MIDERLKARLVELRREYAVGEARLRDLTQQEDALRQTLLRISGAIQVLEEIGAPVDSGSPAGDDPGPDPRILTVA